MTMDVESATVLVLVSFAVAMTGVHLLERFARSRRLLDAPTWRSSHTVPTPRLGGIGLVAGAWVALLLAGAQTPNQLALILAATALAVVGLIDDLRPLPPTLRLAVQGLVACALVVFAAPMTTIVDQGWGVSVPRELGYLLAAVWVVGVVNVWNFMDGVDGIAAGTAAVSALGLITLGNPPVLMIAVIGASLGFLVWNHHPASIFMGDSGSMFLGLLIGGAVLAGETSISFIAAFVVLAPFLLDAAFTLGARMLTGKPLLSAHHEHLYQRLAATGVSQRSIAAAYWLASAGCVLLAIGIDRFGHVFEPVALIVVGSVFVVYVALVRQRERSFDQPTAGADVASTVDEGGVH